jgi:hypothetical protein
MVHHSRTSKGSLPYHVYRKSLIKTANASSFVESDVVKSGRGRVWDRWQKPELEATAHFDLALTGRRVYVGNLPSFDMKPARVDAELKTFFRGFQMYERAF